MGLPPRGAGSAEGAEPVRIDGRELRTVFDTVDLHWLREARRAALDGGSAGSGASLPRTMTAMRELELALIRATDGTLVVTDCELDQVLADVPCATVWVAPNVNPVRDLPRPRGSSARRRTLNP